MQPSIIAILMFFIAFAILCYYLGFIRPPDIFDWMAQGCFIFSAFLMIPFLVYALWTQAGEKDRLQETDIVPHPDILHVVGLTVSLTETPTWVFAVDSSLESATEFYSDENNRPGWAISSDDPEILMLKRNDETMTISVTNTRGDANIIYMLNSK